MTNELTFSSLPSPESLSDAASMQHICEAVRFPADVTAALAEGAGRIAADLALANSAQRYLSELFAGGSSRPAEEVNEELLNSGPDGAMLAAVVYAGAIPQLWARYRQRGIPAEVLIDTVQDLPLWMETHRKRHGRWGLSELGWLYSHLSGELYRLGRLQFHLIPNPFAVKVFQHRESGETVMLADAGIRFRADGQVDGTNGVSDPEGGWTSAYAFDGRRHEGNPISRLGAASRTPLGLDAAEWNLVLQQDDTVLNVHIPEGGRMTPEACRDSYVRAARFFAGHYPERPFGAFVCESWLLAPQFRSLLPEDANIVRFQRDYHLVPVLANEGQTLERVFGFGTKPADLPGLQPQSSLQRAVYDHLAHGGHIHNAGGILLKREVATD
ncbi:acyltransferase domain-containing protein [Cohnella sp. REN36]|uniref:acyltransferase domain-containing protein n=1 Tax=Cohnella sp. REN36 TaxID=2887347 RepID=UPI001D13CE6B|nr:acyltransferase domain-containing protein [Cohnella sp. REN36]MCC3373867.1 acyltransferase domain-containing protein [Cohnella sp. REN36]